MARALLGVRWRPFMSVRPIVLLGHPALRTPAAPVSPELLAGAEWRELIADMFATMLEADGMGLAAPQLGISWQLFVYELEGTGSRVVVNPIVEPVVPVAGTAPAELVEDWEGCLSVPGMRGLVPRHFAVRVRGIGGSGEALDYQADGLEARVIQHEYDHLNGIVFLDRMLDMSSLGYEEELDRQRDQDHDALAGAAVG
jgi:peptide deformylase